MGAATGSLEEGRGEGDGDGGVLAVVMGDRLGPNTKHSSRLRTIHPSSEGTAYPSQHHNESIDRDTHSATATATAIISHTNTQHEEMATPTVQDLEQRIAALEAGRQYQADRAVVQAVESDHLVQLRTMRTALAESGSAAGTATTSREMQALRDENERLKQTVAKLRYRVEHLVDGMEEMMMVQPGRIAAVAEATPKPAST